MKRTLLVLTAAAVLALAGYVHGRWTSRWSVSREIADAVARLNRVPMDFGDWRGEAMKMDRRLVDVAEVDGYLMRRYTNRKTGETASVLLVCGRPGPVAVHTPEVCYTGSGFMPVAGSVVRSLTPDGTAEKADFRVETYRKEGSPAAQSLKIYWSLNAKGGWQSPSNPRIAFAPKPVLYKLYVIRDVSTAEVPADGDPVSEFVRNQLIPGLGRVLFPSA